MRTALRKSIKHLLANATNELLLEVTEVNLAYMRGLTSGNAGSCVALSDESKGAVLDSNRRAISRCCSSARWR